MDSLDACYALFFPQSKFFSRLTWCTYASQLKLRSWNRPCSSLKYGVIHDKIFKVFSCLSMKLKKMYQYYYKFYSNIVIACCYFRYFYNIWCGSSLFEELVGYPRSIIDFHLGNLLGPYRMVHTKVVVESVTWLNYEQTRCRKQLWDHFNIWRFQHLKIL